MGSLQAYRFGVKENKETGVLLESSHGASLALQYHVYVWPFDDDGRVGRCHGIDLYRENTMLSSVLAISVQIAD